MEHASALGVDSVVPVCHTWETKAQNYRHLLPQNTSYVSLIGAGASGVADEASVRRVATVSTNATAESGAYKNAIRAVNPRISVTEVKGLDLAPLIEDFARGDVPSRRPLQEAVRRVLAAVPKDVDVVVHACTHYSFVDNEFARYLPPGVKRVSSVGYQAQRVKELLGERASVGGNETKFYTTGDAEEFRTQVRSLLNIENPDVEHIRDFGDKASSDEHSDA